MDIFVCMYVCALCVCLVPTETRRGRVSDPMDPELQRGVNCHDQGEAFRKKTQGSQESVYPGVPGPLS